jgi:lysozyme family protein
MDGDTGLADTNEGLIGDALHRLAFGRPAMHSRLVRARTRGQEDTVLNPGQHYVTLTLATLSLASNRILTSRFRPVFYAQAAFAQDLRRPIQMAALVADPQDANPKGADPATANLTSEGLAVGDRRLFGQTPWRGRLDVQLSLLACRSEAILKALLPLSDDIRKSLSPAGGVDATAPAGAALRSLIPGSLAMDLASATARAFIRMDGNWTARCEYSGAVTDLAPGHYVLLALRHDSEAPPALEYDPETLALSADGRRVQGRDYAVLRVEASTRRENISDLPDLGEAFEAIDLVFAAGGDTAPALEKFRRLAMTSPHLTESDRKDLIQRVVRRTESLKAAIENPEERNESILSSIARAGGVLDLSALWSVAPRLLEGLKSATAAVGAPTAPQSGGPDASPDASDASPASPPATPPPPLPSTPVPSTPVRDPGSRFQQVLAFTLRWEGGFSDDPADAGGRTMRGVTEAVFHAWLADQGELKRPVETLKEEELVQIYRTNYWLSARCSDLPLRVDLCQFDAAVNHGPQGAARLLQRAVNRNLAEMQQPLVAVDGALGPVTLREARRIEPKRLYQAYLIERRALYQRIVERKPDQQKFLKGWLNRVADLELFIQDASNESITSNFPPITPEDTALAGYVE